MAHDNYKEIVDKLESKLGGYAMKSFDSEVFVDGSDLYAYYNNLWQTDSEIPKLVNRTPIQHQRDRILYSSGIRRQSERYHVLYHAEQKITRNYITHTMRMMQVARTICRALDLNEDFAEAIVLGSKVGALPFIHASKNRVSKWIEDKIDDLDTKELTYDTNEPDLGLHSYEYLPNYPEWIRKIRSKKVLSMVEKCIPFATGKAIDEAYSSGQQGYWLLTTNPYTLESKGSSFSPELIYGIWRHSVDNPFGKDSFIHEKKISCACKNCHKIAWNDINYESIVVRYADDITWVIENLNDSNNALLLNDHKNKGLFVELLNQEDLNNVVLMQGLSKSDSGILYSYFINDFINYSLPILKKNDPIECKSLLKEGDDSFLIGLSHEGKDVLKLFKDFLTKRVFSENRVYHRKQMLETITEGCMELIYKGKGDFLIKYIKSKAAIESWGYEQTQKALLLLDNEVHRIQVAVNIFSEFSDHEIFSFIGMDSF